MIDLKLFDPTDANAAMRAAERANRIEALLLETRRAHDRGYNEESCDYPPCPRSRDEDNSGPGELEDKCSCGAEAWNARIDVAVGSK